MESSNSIKIEDEVNDGWSESSSALTPNDPKPLPPHLLNLASKIITNLNRPSPPTGKDTCDVSSLPQAPLPPSMPAPPPPPNSNGIFDGQTSEIDLSEMIKMAGPILANLFSKSVPSNKDDLSEFVGMIMTCLGDCVSSTNGTSDPSTQAYVFIDKLFCCYKMISMMYCSKHRSDPLFNFAFNSMDKSVNQQFTNAMEQLSMNNGECLD